MKKSHLTIAILAAGGLGLYLWYRSRSGATGSGLLGLQPGQGSTGVPGGQSQVVNTDSPSIVAARAAATGPGSRSRCSLPSRWIKTVEPPYYGFCVTQPQFDDWMRIIGASAGPAPTNAFVQNFLATRSNTPAPIGSGKGDN